MLIGRRPKGLFLKDIIKLTGASWELSLGSLKFHLSQMTLTKERTMKAKIILLVFSLLAQTTAYAEKQNPWLIKYVGECNYSATSVANEPACTLTCGFTSYDYIKGYLFVVTYYNTQTGEVRSNSVGFREWNPNSSAVRQFKKMCEQERLVYAGLIAK